VRERNPDITMARLNTHLSATPVPRPTRSSTVDSLYRDPSVQPSGGRLSSYSVLSPSLSQSSDKENEQPDSRDNTPRPVAKGKRPMAPPGARLPTPTSGSSLENGNKRRRTNAYDVANSSQIFQDEDGEAEGDDTMETVDEEEDELTKYYDPHQDPDVRRQLRAGIRNHHRELEGTVFAAF
jgi:non-structural maintenance of chromosomes element 4